MSEKQVVSFQGISFKVTNIGNARRVEIVLACEGDLTVEELCENALFLIDYRTQGPYRILVDRVMKALDKLEAR